MKHLKKILVIIIILVVWEWGSGQNPTLKFLLSSPRQSLQYAIDNIQQLLEATLYTSTESFCGFIIAFILSFILMLLCIIHPILLKKIRPFIIASQILPMITLAPIFIVLFGMGIISKIAMVVLMCFFPVFVNFTSGIKNISPNIHELLYIYNTPKKYSIFKVIIPLSTPYIFSGLKISTTMAIMGAIVAEFMGAKMGLGKNLYLAPKNSKADLMICSIFFIILLGMLLYHIIEIIEKKIGKWYLHTNNNNY